MLPEDERQQQFETIPLYKYHAFPADPDKRRLWVREILTEHKLFFATRKDFNDPFDCVVPSFLQTPGTIVKRFAEELVTRKFPHDPPAEQLAKICKLMSIGALQGMRADIQKDVDQAGIACFSKVRDDILMWAHYADKHKGLCLEFDGSANCNFFGYAQEVKYQDFAPVPFPLGGDGSQAMERVILTKSKHWTYEQEYRIFGPETAGQKVEYPVELLTGIIFGCMMGENDRQLVKQWPKKENAAWLSSRLNRRPLNSVWILFG
jgi:DUF2971 family protein